MYTYNLKNEISQIFKDWDLKLTFEPCSDTANFLNVTLNLKSGTYEPLRKVNNDFLYVNAHSNHPPIVTQNIPLNIEKMINDLCSNEDIFNKAKCDFQDALKESGYDYNIEFKEKIIRKRKELEVDRFYGLIHHIPAMSKQTLAENFLN